MKKARQNLLSGCLALAFTVSTALSPALAMASPVFTTATTNDTLRLGGIDRYETAAKIVQQGWSTSDNAVLSAGMDENLVDALTAAPLAKAKNAPILLTEGTTLNSYAKQELTRLGVKTVYVTSGIGVIQQSVLDQLASMGISVKPLGGTDRFETALNIAKELPTANEFVVTTAWTNADALSVASIAAAKGMPILLTDAQSLNANVKTYIDSIKISKTFVLGGTGVVSDSAKAGLPNPVRIGGADRFATNQEILKAFASDLKPGQVFIANGQNEHLVDSLAGSPYAAQSKSPVVLTDGMLTEATKSFVKLNLLPNKVIALGGEAVVGAEVLTALTASTTYSEDGAIKGSSDATTLEEVQEVLKITGKNITVKNTKASYSIYIQGDNVTLDNVTVAGTVFVDPGQAGTTNLNGVKADKIVVMSGGQDSIHIANSTAGTLLVTSDSQTRVEATGTTTVGNTVVTSYAILDANGGSLGQVLVTTEPGKDAVVELRGTFTEPVVVEGQVTLKAAANAVVPSVIIATQNAEQKVTLDGTFKAIDVTNEGKVELAANAKVETMVTTAKATVTVPPSAKIDTLDAGTSGSLVGGGGTVNNQTTTTTPSTPPPTTTTPPAGGGGPGVTQLKVTSVETLGTGAIPQSKTNSGTNNFTFDFTGLNDNEQITGLKLVGNGSSPELEINAISTRGVSWIEAGKSIRSSIASDGTVTIGSLLGGLDARNDGISLGNFRLIFGTDDVVIEGKITQSAYTESSKLTVTINLGTSNSNVSRVENTWMIVEKDPSTPKHAIVTVKPSQGSVTLGTITSGGNFNFAQVVAAMVIGDDNYQTNGTQTALQLKQAIGVASDAAFDAVTLSQLVGKGISFGAGYTVTFVQ